MCSLQFIASCRWVASAADCDWRQKYLVSAEQQINSCLFAYMCSERAESRQKVKGRMYRSEITLRCCPAFTFTDPATERFHPLICQHRPDGRKLNSYCRVRDLLSDITSAFLLTCWDRSCLEFLRGTLIVTARTDGVSPWRAPEGDEARVGFIHKPILMVWEKFPQKLADFSSWKNKKGKCDDSQAGQCVRPA